MISSGSLYDTFFNIRFRTRLALTAIDNIAGLLEKVPQRLPKTEPFSSETQSKAADGGGKGGWIGGEK